MCVCVCVCVRVRACVRACARACVRAYARAYVYISVHVYVYPPLMCVWGGGCIRAYMHVCACVCMCMCACICVHVYVYPPLTFTTSNNLTHSTDTPQSQHSPAAKMDGRVPKVLAFSPLHPGPALAFRFLQKIVTRHRGLVKKPAAKGSRCAIGDPARRFIVTP